MKGNSDRLAQYTELQTLPVLRWSRDVWLAIVNYHWPSPPSACTVSQLKGDNRSRVGTYALVMVLLNSGMYKIFASDLGCLGYDN